MCSRKTEPTATTNIIPTSNNNKLYIKSCPFPCWWPQHYCPTMCSGERHSQKFDAQKNCHPTCSDKRYDTWKLVHKKSDHQFDALERDATHCPQLRSMVQNFQEEVMHVLCDHYFKLGSWCKRRVTTSWMFRKELPPTTLSSEARSKNAWKNTTNVESDHWF